MTKEKIVQKLSDKGLRITPQRLAIHEAILALDNHPIAENIIAYIQKNHPSISTGTVYKVLDSFVEHGILTKVKTEGGTMRFDPVVHPHHHLYCQDSERIEDYNDEKLDQMIKDYFASNGIDNFNIQNIQLQITGKFLKK